MICIFKLKNIKKKLKKFNYIIIFQNSDKKQKNTKKFS